MSEHWSLVCATCNEPGDYMFRWNHGEDELARLLPALPAIAALAPFRQFDPHGRTLTVQIRDTTFEDGLIEFAAKHHTHDVRVRSEYGRDYDQCTDRVACGACTTWHPCKLKKDHDGLCKAQFEAL